MCTVASILVLLPIVIAVLACWESLLDYTRYDPKFFNFSMQVQRLAAEETNAVHAIASQTQEDQQVKHKKYCCHKTAMASTAVVYLIAGITISILQEDFEPLLAMSPFTTAAIFFYYRISAAEKRNIRWRKRVRKYISK